MLTNNNNKLFIEIFKGYLFKILVNNLFLVRFKRKLI
jgi:hypothetical protein